MTYPRLYSTLLIASLCVFTGPMAPAHAEDEIPSVDEIFEYLETFDFAGPDDVFPQGISSIGSNTGGEFPNLSAVTDGKTGAFVNGAAFNPEILELVTGEGPAVNLAFFARIIIGGLAAEFTLLEAESARVEAVANSDPYLARRISVTNPFDETTTFRFEAALEMVPLDPITAIGEGRFSAEVFDTGGDAGAELEFNLGHTLRQADSLDELSVQVGHSGTINEGELSTLDADPITGFAVALEDFDRMLSSVFLTLSPGDTAVVTTIGSFGDATIPLNPLEDIEADLAIAVAVGNQLNVPEPSSLLLLSVSCLGLVGCRRRPTRDRA